MQDTGSWRRVVAGPSVAQRSGGAVGASSRVTSVWESRLFVGVRVPRVPADVRLHLARALGEIGVESEFLLTLVAAFRPTGRATRDHGQILLRQLEATGYRLIHAAASLEVATQGFLAALDASYPEIERDKEYAEPWWPPYRGYALGGESFEMRMRRCGYAYRHVVAARLHANVETIADHAALTLHALSTLPPAGVAPISSLYQGLYELTASLQGDLIPHAINDVSRETPGLLNGIALLRGLDASEDTSVQADIMWAQSQYAAARAAFDQMRALPAQAVPEATVRWAEYAVGEWQTLIGALRQLQQTSR